MKRLAFSEAMIHALQGGRKTQTRRVLKPQPGCVIFRDGRWYEAHNAFVHQDEVLTPKFQPGDRVAVTEAWRTEARIDDLKPSDISHARIHYEADGRAPEWAGRYRHARSMPAWATRMHLVIKSVRVERVMDIGEADAKAEGVEFFENVGCYTCGEDQPCGCHDPRPGYRETFIWLWDSIHGEGAWERNDFCWVYEFEVVTP
jgi:hypothetical protein